MKHKLKQLAAFDTPDSDGSGKITIHPLGLGGATYHSWQKQERFKGRWGQSALGGTAGTSEMGWATDNAESASRSTDKAEQSVSPPLTSTINPQPPTHHQP